MPAAGQRPTSPPPDTTLPGVSVVIPVHNGDEWLDHVIAAIEAQHYAGPLEIIAVEDGSSDNSRDILQRHAAAGRLTVLDGERRGAAAALNLGIRAASHPLIAQIDQDVVIGPSWLQRLVDALANPIVGAAQGHYIAAPDAGIWSRVMALDLRQRYRELGEWTNHVCTGNSVYRRAALVQIGLFDETLGYGYDNDVSYRLTQAGYKLAFRADATSTHDWREGLMSYARQQYGFGYGRIDLVAKHRRRVAGDDVSRTTMMLHGPIMAVALGLLAALPAVWLAGWPASAVLTSSAALAGLLAAERAIAGLKAVTAFGDGAGYWFTPVHLVRDVSWALAIVVWTFRRVTGGKPRPSDSMTPRIPA